MLARVGDADHMMEHFIAGLTRWRSLGPPSLTQYVMSEQEVTHAMEKNLLDDEMGNLKNLIEFEESELEEQSMEKVTSAEVQTGPNISDDVCFSCGDELSLQYVAAYQEKLSRLKQIINSQ